MERFAPGAPGGDAGADAGDAAPCLHGRQEGDAEYADVNIGTNAMIRGIPREKDLMKSGRPEMPMPWQVERYLNAPRGELWLVEHWGRRTIRKGFVNPRVVAHLKPKIVNILEAGASVGVGDFRGLNSTVERCAEVYGTAAPCARMRYAGRPPRNERPACGS